MFTTSYPLVYISLKSQQRYDIRDGDARMNSKRKWLMSWREVFLWKATLHLEIYIGMTQAALYPLSMYVTIKRQFEFTHFSLTK